jgi:hypothetical protein
MSSAFSEASFSEFLFAPGLRGLAILFLPLTLLPGVEGVEGEVVEETEGRLE